MTNATLYRPFWATDQRFIADVLSAVEKAIERFPAPNPTIAALTEEVGEATQAVLHVREGKAKGADAFRHIWEECVQVAATALRLATEGDHTVGVQVNQGGHDR